MNAMILKSTGNPLLGWMPGWMRWVALISILTATAPSCSSAPVSEHNAKAKEVSMGEYVGTERAQNQEERGGEPNRNRPSEGFCEEVRVQQVALAVRRFEPAQSPALKELNAQCSVSDRSVALKPFECSCEVLEKFLQASQAVALWENACCESSVSCSRAGRCAPVELEGDAFINRLLKAHQVATALGQVGLHCERPTCRATPEGCQQSEICALSGKCGVARNGTCAPVTESHCAQSINCRDNAECRLDSPGGQCVLDCTHPSMCMAQGYCSYEDGRCEASEPSHCEASEACAEEGRCYLETLEDYAKRKWQMGGPPRGCYSKVDRAVEVAQNTLDQTLRTAVIPLLRMALKAEDAGHARVQIPRYHPRYDWLEQLGPVFYVDVSVPPSDSLRARYRVDCRTFFAELRALRPATVHQNGIYQILADPYRLRTSKHVLIDGLESACDPKDHTRVSPMSWVGPIVSLNFDYYLEPDDDYGREYVGESYRTLDLRTGEAAKLDALIEPASIVDAIKGDSWVQQFIGRTEEHIADEKTSTEQKQEATALLAKFRRATDLEELEGLLQEIVSSATRHDSKPSFQGYAFYSYDAKKNRVALRLSLGSIGIGGIGRATVLGLWVTPRQEFEELFRQAHAEDRLMAGGNPGFPGFSGSPW